MKSTTLIRRGKPMLILLLVVGGGFALSRPFTMFSQLKTLSDADLEKSNSREARRELLRRAVERGDGETVPRLGFALVRTPSATAADYLMAAEACKTTRHTNHAFWLFNDGVRRFPRSEQLLRERATFLREQHNAPEELAALNAWLATAPNAIEPNARLGDWHFKNGAVEVARGHYERALRSNPRLPIAVRRVALAAYLRGDLGNAEMLARDALAMTPEEPVAHLLLGQILMSAGHSSREEAAAALSKAVERDPKLASAHLFLGVLAEEAGDWPSARQRYERCLKVSPQNSAAMYHLARCLEALGVKKEAADLRVRHRKIEEGLLEARRLTMNLASNPSQPRVGLRLARLYRELGQRSEALAAYRRVLDLRPGDRRLREEMAPFLSPTEAGP